MLDCWWLVGAVLMAGASLISRVALHCPVCWYASVGECLALELQNSHFLKLWYFVHKKISKAPQTPGYIPFSSSVTTPAVAGKSVTLVSMCRVDWKWGCWPAAVLQCLQTAAGDSLPRQTWRHRRRPGQTGHSRYLRHSATPQPQHRAGGD